MRFSEREREIIKNARDRIADPEHWCRDDLAQTRDGAACDISDPHADKFCACGALAFELFQLTGDENEAVAEAIRLGNRIMGGSTYGLGRINDKSGHELVLANPRLHSEEAMSG
jgi:hypothetical protein